MGKAVNNIDLAHHRIFYKDFDGSRSEKKGFGRDRSFLVELDREEAELYSEEGWPVKYRAPKNEEEDEVFFFKVKVAFGKVPPKIVVGDPSTKKKKVLTENNVADLNWIGIADIPAMILRRYDYDFNGRTGSTVYLNSLYVVMKVNPLDQLFQDYTDADDPDPSNDD